MIYYLNLGFIVEQALQDIIKTYIDRLQLDDVYSNFHISVTNTHPFAHMIIEQNATAQDYFPSIVITSQSDGKIPEMNQMPVQTSGIGLTSEDLEKLISDTTREKTIINDEGEIETVTKRNGEVVRENIPGYVFIYDEKIINKLKEIADSRPEKMVYGLRIDSRRRDRISIEIWAENNQLKNEIYEHLRLLCSSSLDMLLSEKYKMFDPCIFDGSVNGERSSNYNYDFDVVLTGSHISFEIDYSVSQLIIDTDINNISKELITEVINHVKE